MHALFSNNSNYNFKYINGLIQTEKVKVMKDVKKKNEHLEVLLVENQLLKQQTQEQEEQMDELKKKLQGDDCVHNFLVLLYESCMTLIYRERKNNEEVVH